MRPDPNCPKGARCLFSPVYPAVASGGYKTDFNLINIIATLSSYFFGEWLLMTRHVVDINVAYTKKKIDRNVEYNFHDRCTYLTLQAVFSFSAIIFVISARNATVSTNSKQVGLRHSRGVNMFYFSGLSF